MDIKIEPIQEAKIPQPSPTSNKQKISKHDHRRITRSQTVGKGNLEDILEALDIEETPVVRVEDIEGDKKKKKGKTVKKLAFAGEDVGFIFQPRKPLTRLQLAKGVMANKKTGDTNKGKQPITEDIVDLSPVAEAVIVQRKGKEKMVEKLKCRY